MHHNEDPVQPSDKQIKFKNPYNKQKTLFSHLFHIYFTESLKIWKWPGLLSEWPVNSNGQKRRKVFSQENRVSWPGHCQTWVSVDVWTGAELSCARTPGPGSESQAARGAVTCVSGASVIRFLGCLPRLFLYVMLALSVVWPVPDSHVSPPELQRDGSWAPTYARVWWWSSQGRERLGNGRCSLCCSAWRSWFVKGGTVSAQGPSVVGW